MGGGEAGRISRERKMADVRGNVASGLQRSWGAWRRVGCTLALLVCASVLAIGCDRKREYAQDTPDAVLKSAVQMVKDGNSKQLPSLIYADSAEMRATLDGVGELLGNMQKLSRAVEARFPQEIAEMKRIAAEKVASGEAGSIFDKVLNEGTQRRPSSGPSIQIGTTASKDLGGKGGSGPSVQVQIGGSPPPSADTRTPRTPGERADMRNEFRDLFNRLFADPYGWLEQNGEKLSTIQVTDEMATIMYDNQPLMGGMTLPMQKHDGKWYVALPLTMPPMNQILPKTSAQWSILRSVVQVLNKTVIDMTADVQSGRVNSLDSLGRNAQEKVMFPAIIAFGAYGKEMDVSGRIDRRFRQFQERQKKWNKDRAEIAAKEVGGDAKGFVAISPKLISAMNTVAPIAIEKVVRANKRSEFEKLSDAEFEALVDGWLRDAGLKINFTEALTPERVDVSIAQWSTDRKAQLERDAKTPRTKK